MIRMAGDSLLSVGFHGNRQEASALLHVLSHPAVTAHDRIIINNIINDNFAYNYLDVIIVLILKIYFCCYCCYIIIVIIIEQLFQYFYY